MIEVYKDGFDYEYGSIRGCETWTDYNIISDVTGEELNEDEALLFNGDICRDEDLIGREIGSGIYRLDSGLETKKKPFILRVSTPEDEDWKFKVDGEILDDDAVEDILYGLHGDFLENLDTCIDEFENPSNYRDE